MKCFFRDINCGSINNYFIDVQSFQVHCKWEECVVDKTTARLSMREKKKPSGFTIFLEGLTKLVSFALKLKNLFDLFK